MATTHTSEAPGAAGDSLSHRVAARRAEVGLSLEEAGERSGIDPEYLQYLEHHADATLSMGSLLLLAMTLQTSPEELMGANRPARRERGTGGHPILEDLTVEQCEAHLSAGGIGRIVFHGARGPVAVPVNFEYTDGQVILSTDEEKAARLTTAVVVGFEVDRVDDALSEGWSVLVTGPARRIDDETERETLSSLGLEAWVGDDPHTLVAVTPTEITGRVIVHPLPVEAWSET